MRPRAGLLLVALAAAAPSWAERPEVTAVEPPSWWPGHSLNPVRLLVRGRSLTSATVAGGTGLTATLVRVSEAGTYAFIDVTIDPKAAPGPRRIRIETPLGTTAASFELLAPPPREGRFQGFSTDDVVYLLMPDRFANGNPANDDPQRSKGLHDRKSPRFYHGGDLEGVIARLPYLKDLGVTALWLNPWYDNSDTLNRRELVDGKPVTDYHGYGAVDFYAVDEHLGSLATLKDLVDAAHRHGLKVIQDQVANHTGPYHPWVADPPTATWFNGTEAHHLKNEWQTWTLADPHATPGTQRQTLEGWFIDILPDLNQDDPEVARYLIQNSLWWVGITGIDAIRQDTLPYVPRAYWRAWTEALAREHPSLTVVGEMWDGDPALVSYFQGGVARDGIDTGISYLFDFPLFYPLRRAFAEGKPLREVASMLAHDRLYGDPTQLVTFLGLHDVDRFLREPGASLAGLELAFTFLMTTRGLPLIYYGDEVALRGADNREDFPGGWTEDSKSGFEAAGRTPEQQRLHDHVRRLAHLRAELLPLRRGRLVSLLVEEQAWAYARSLEGAPPVIVAFNNASQPATLAVPAGPTGLADGTALTDRLERAPEVKVEEGLLRVRLAGRSAAVYVPRAQ